MCAVQTGLGRWNKSHLLQMPDPPRCRCACSANGKTWPGSGVPVPWALLQVHARYRGPADESVKTVGLASFLTLGECWPPFLHGTGDWRVVQEQEGVAWRVVQVQATGLSDQSTPPHAKTKGCTWYRGFPSNINFHNKYQKQTTIYQNKTKQEQPRKLMTNQVINQKIYPRTPPPPPQIPKSHIVALLLLFSVRRLATWLLLRAPCCPTGSTPNEIGHTA